MPMLSLDGFEPLILQREVQHALRRDGLDIEQLSHPVFAFHVEPWDQRAPEVATGHRVMIGAHEIPVFYCPTELAIRYVLRLGEPAIVLTPLDVRVLHDESVERLHRGRIVRIEVAHQISTLFGTTATDPRMSRWRTLAQWLVDESVRDPAPFPTPDGDQLGERHAWESLFGRLFAGVSPRNNSTRALLSLLDSSVLRRLTQLAEDRRRELFDALEHFEYRDLALALEVLWSMQAGETRAGEGREETGRESASDGPIISPLAGILVLDELRSHLDTGGVDGLEAKIYARVGKFHLEDVFENRASALTDATRTISTVLSVRANGSPNDALDVSEHLLREVAAVYRAMGVDELSARSRFTKEGWQRVVYDAASVVRESPKNDKDERARRLAEVWQALGVNAYADVFERKARRTAESLIRLANGIDAGSVSASEDVVDDWIRSGSFVNQLLEELAHLTLVGELGDAYDSLRGRWAAKNAELDVDVARAASELQKRDSVLPGAIAMSRFGRELVLPLRADHQDGVLVVVLDGMSWSAFHQLSASDGLRRWSTYVPVQGESFQSLQAPVPTVTKLARHALLTGSVDPNGTQALERAGFADQFDGGPLFHKAHLRTDRLGDVAKAIANGQFGVVGVVVNAIDDSLSHSNQVQVNYEEDLISIFGELLRLAEDAGRIVVLASDHGHIVPTESTSAGSGGEGGERYRADDQPLHPGEVEIVDDRFEDAFGNRRLRVACDLERHYSLPSRGYHGGAHRAELLAPAVILAPRDARLDTRRFRLFDSAASKPAWWNAHAAEDISIDAEDTVSVAASKGLARSNRQTQKKRAPQEQSSLFAQPDESVEGPVVDSVFELHAVRVRLLNEEKIAGLDETTREALWSLLRQSKGRVPLQQFVNQLALSPRMAARVCAAVQRGLNQAMRNAAQLDEHGVLRIDLENLSQAGGRR